ncbi:MAG: 4-(cytidine 5'-diphospho)-2-C-methyl-D-erythritol kinase [bacterium]|nr:4-(cytidine 5'-diphospho)-2-C-methyl-D-erythritol kinase [bacterium]
MKILAPAKINLALDVLNKGSSGYHEIQTIFHEIPGLCNEVEIIEGNFANNRMVDVDRDLAQRALLLFKEKFSIKKNIQVRINRKIPPGSGLGGESSNAAAVLKGLNKLWDLGISEDQLLILAAKIGMDVPFFIIGGTAHGTHYGEKITPLKPIKNLQFKVETKSVNTPDKTKLAYHSLDLAKCGKNTTKTEKLLEAIEKNDHQGIVENLHNDFETQFIVKKGRHLSGSGPSTFSV